MRKNGGPASRSVSQVPRRWSAPVLPVEHGGREPYAAAGVISVEVDQEAQAGVAGQRDGARIRLQRFGRKRGGARDPHAGTAHHFEDQAEPARFAFRAVEPAAQKAARVIDPFFGGGGGARELSFREHRRVFAYFVGDNYPMPRGKTCERFGARSIIPTPPLARCYRAQGLNFFRLRSDARAPS